MQKYYCIVTTLSNGACLIFNFNETFNEHWTEVKKHRGRKVYFLVVSLK